MCNGQALSHQPYLALIVLFFPEPRSRLMSTVATSRNRRQFMEDVGSGMLLAGLGGALAGDLGISTAFAKEGAASLDFGSLRPMVQLMQDTPPETLQPALVKKLR